MPGLFYGASRGAVMDEYKFTPGIMNSRRRGKKFREIPASVEPV
jgi:hypothetical protein